MMSFQYFLYYNKLYKRSISKQRYSQFDGSVIENVTKLSSKSFSSLSARLAHAARLGFFLQKRTI